MFLVFLINYKLFWICQWRNRTSIIEYSWRWCNSSDVIQTERQVLNIKGNITIIDLIQNENNVTITFKNISKSEIQVQSQDLFERFVQGDRSRHNEGSGLGLAIVKIFTEMQHGTCDLNVDGDLFKVTLTFPITNSNII